ncbi:MAG TPA: DUF1772 domain-containing protein [Chitinophagaceae bacterium]|nr:DUF1772 domain-containing protein [Chitinophagaceae bacterium]
MKKIVLFLSITIMAGVAFANMYNSIVDTTSWISNVPGSIAVFRQYYHSVNPGNFFRIFSPVNQILALLSLILFWKTSKKVRIFLLVAFFLAVSGDVLTFVYFYPRNDLLMNLPLQDNSAKFTHILKQWRSMNWIRTLIIFTGLLFLCLGLNRIYQNKTPHF